MGVVRALRRPGRERAVLQPRGGQVRPAPPHPVQHQGHVGRLGPGVVHLAGHGRRRVHRQGALRGGRYRRAVSPVLSRCARAGEIPRRVLPHRPVAEDRGGLQGQAGRGHRHRVKRRADHPGHRPRGRLADRVPAHAELGHPAQQPAGYPGGAGRAEGELRGDPRHRRHVGVRVPAPAVGQDDLRRLGRRAAGVLRAGLAARRVRQDHTGT